MVGVRRSVLRRPRPAAASRPGRAVGPALAHRTAADPQVHGDGRAAPVAERRRLAAVRPRLLLAAPGDRDLSATRLLHRLVISILGESALPLERLHGDLDTVDCVLGTWSPSINK